ncbi:MAG TPA: PfkB family carbohydrate kinase [Chthoniobacterales bacterium]|jgi:D-beta-D-heptose 7-phosphate kinase/D-beta-D-heptose 1-phosphate adenosyltransferase|nr:PfkB family carbohydrate kinase [Chthoniobacterales bacterium]
MDLRRLRQILERAASKRILVIGDLMLDEFVWGRVGRISPEAPVPVVQVTGESFFPGGAANVARNLREFLDMVSVIGLMGKDRGGQQLRELLAKEKIDVSDSIEDEKFPTIVKTRIIARHQQVVRVDREKIIKPSAAQIGKVVAAVKEKLPNIDAIIFEDYGKGFLTRELVSRVAREASAAKKIVTADPNPHNLIEWSGMTAVKPNRAEAFLAAGIPDRDLDLAPNKDVELVRAGKELLQKWSVQYLLVTLGEHGVMFFEKGKHPHYIPTRARDVFDVSGAGDTAIAMFTLALVSTATPIEAAQIANHASAVVVGKLGTATVTRDELISKFEHDFD